MKKVLKFVFVFFLLIVLVGCSYEEEEVKESKAKAVEDLIETIGEVTMEDETLINNALEQYGALSEEEKKQVGNISLLLDAQITLESLKFLVELDIDFDTATLEDLQGLSEKISNLNPDVANKIQNQINAAQDKLGMRAIVLEFEKAVNRFSGELNLEQIAI